jgi:hypothetical protein
MRVTNQTLEIMNRINSDGTPSENTIHDLALDLRDARAELEQAKARVIELSDMKPQTLRQRVMALEAAQKKHHLTVAMLVVAAGGSIRVSMLDYLKAEKVAAVESWTDQKNNDQVYTVGVTAPETPANQSTGWVYDPHCLCQRCNVHAMETKGECSTCGGTGEIDETLGGVPTSNPHSPCPDCTSKIPAETKAEPIDCAGCNGTGYVGTGIDEMPTETCKRCGGLGSVQNRGEKR